MRIHWDAGPRLYETAQEATYDLRKRVYTMEIPRSTTMDSTGIAMATSWRGKGRWRSPTSKGKATGISTDSLIVISSSLWYVMQR